MLCFRCHFDPIVSHAHPTCFTAPTLLDRMEVDVSSLCQVSASNIVLQGRLGSGNADFDPQIVVVAGDDDCTDAAFAVHALSSLLLIVPLFVLSALREF